MTLWDFSGYNSITTEPVPAEDETQAMRWYWESSHFKRETGELMLARILGSNADASIPQGFGVRLTDETVDAVLARMREGRSRYRAQHPEELQSVADSVQRTRETRAGLCR